MLVSLKGHEKKKSCWLHLLLPAVLACMLFAAVPKVAAQDGQEDQEQEPAKPVQRESGRLELGAEKEIYLLEDLQAGETLYATMQTTSGNLDPMLAVVDAATDLAFSEAAFQAEVQGLLAGDDEISLALKDLHNRSFLDWDDDSGPGYAAALVFPITVSGDYYLIAGSAPSAVSPDTSGDYTLLVGLNEPGVLDGSVRPTGDTIAVLDLEVFDNTIKVSETSGVLSVDSPQVVLELEDILNGDTLHVFVEATVGNLRPVLVLRDFGDKPLEVANLSGQETSASLTFVLPDDAIGYSLAIRGAAGDDGQPTTGGFRALVGLNEPQVLTGQASVTRQPVVKEPIEVQVGVKIDRLSEVRSADEAFTIIGSVRMDWQDPNLAYSPDSCNCDIKIYTGTEFDQFLEDSASRWPNFTFFNQLGNRWVQNRVVMVWPDGRARYVERFSTTFQADFNFQEFPFDVQQFPILFDMIRPANVYTLTELPDYSAISPNHGEDEFIVGEFTSATDMVVSSDVADHEVSRMIFSFEAPRHLEYYVLQVFVPILLIIAISWFTFFLKDYTRRIEASAANILLFIAFSFSLANNYPRLGYVTFLDAIMAVAFIVNALVLLYNVQMKRLENRGEIERARRIDNIVDWAYPLSYAILIAVVAIIFLGAG